MSADRPPFDPWAIIGALEKHRVNYVLIGALAGVLHGTDELTSGVDICPQMKAENIERLEAALVELGASTDGSRTFAMGVDDLAPDAVTRVDTSSGPVQLVPEPRGSSGWDDLRRAATREALGRGLRASVASVDDLGRLMTSLGRDADRSRLAVLRRLGELERGRGIAR